MSADRGLPDLHVLELTDTPGAAFASALFADFGAEVVVCESPGGSALRRLGPRAGLLWEILGRNKQSVILREDEGPRSVALLQWADLLITDRTLALRLPEPLRTGWSRIEEGDRPLLVEVFPTGVDCPQLWPWGQRAEFAAAATGMMALTGHRGEAPVQTEAPIAEYLSGVLAATRALAALRREHLEGTRSAPIAVPLHQAIQRMIEWQLPVATAMGVPELRRGNDFPLSAGVANMCRARDGTYMAVSAVTPVTVERLLQMIGGAELRQDGRFSRNQGRIDDVDALYALLQEWIGRRTAAEVLAAAAAHDVVLGPIYTTAEILADQHMAVRGNVVQVDGVTMPGVVPHIEGIASALRLGPPLGSHRQASSAPAGEPTRPPSMPIDRSRFRVLELGTVIAGPMAGSLLAELGGDVIKVERPGSDMQAGDPLRHMGPKKSGVPLWFGVAARSKRCVTLNLKDPEGKSIFKRLVMDADVLIENYRPGVLNRLGLGWEDLRAINPRLVMLSISGFGQFGPQAQRPGFGKIAEGLSGVVNLTGTLRSGPLFVGFSLGDSCSGLFGAFAAALCLYRRDVKAADGTRIDLALYEPLLRLLDCQLALHDLAGRPPERGGTNDPYGYGAVGPAGPAFQVVVTDGGEWFFIALPDSMVIPANVSREELRHRVTAARGTLIPIFDGGSIAADRYFQARRDAVWTDVPEIGRIAVPGAIEGTAVPAFRAPGLGEDNATVYGAIGVDSLNLSRLRELGVI